METLIRCHIMRHLIWVCTVCLCTPFRVSRQQWVRLERLAKVKISLHCCYFCLCCSHELHLCTRNKPTKPGTCQQPHNFNGVGGKVTFKFLQANEYSQTNFLTHLGTSNSALCFSYAPSPAKLSIYSRPY